MITSKIETKRLKQTRNIPELEMLEFRFEALDVDPPGFGIWRTVKTAAAESAWISIVSRKGIFSFGKSLE